MADFQGEVLILAGCSGAGKSSFVARRLEEHAKEFEGNPFRFASVVSADHFFTDQDGKYTFVPEKIGEAHKQCLRKFLSVIASDHNQLLIVDNTNTTMLEMAPYVSVAGAYDRRVKIVILSAEDGQIPMLAKRNLHGVPEKSIRRMNDNLKRFHPPPFWSTERGVDIIRLPIVEG